jgi:hypothetical protein
VNPPASIAAASLTVIDARSLTAPIAPALAFGALDEGPSCDDFSPLPDAKVVALHERARRPLVPGP